MNEETRENMRMRTIGMRYNAATDRWDVLTPQKKVVFDSEQKDIFDCTNLEHYFANLNPHKVNLVKIITIKIGEEEL